MKCKLPDVFRVGGEEGVCRSRPPGPRRSRGLGHPTAPCPRRCSSGTEATGSAPGCHRC